MEFTVNIYLIQLIHGLVYGLLIFLVASGLTLVFGMMGVLNLAHAALYMIGAYIAYMFSQMLGPEGFWMSLFIAPILMALISVIIYYLLRLSRRKEHVAELLLTFGLFFIFVEVVIIISGSELHKVPTPQILAGAIPFFGSTYPVYRLFILFFSLILMILMTLMLARTRIGILIRAAVADGEMVSALGINVHLLVVGVFAASGALAGIAGVVSAPFLSVYPGMGMEIFVDSFVVIIAGGLGSLFGAFIAALMVGELQAFGILWIPKFALILPYLFMVIVLILKPSGLFGRKE